MNTDKGIALVEVLVALIVLSVGLLGVAALQVQSLKSNSSSYHRSQAVLLSYDITERMRANRFDARNGLYNISSQVVGQCKTALSAESSLAAQDKKDWINSVACLLSEDATVQVSVTASENVTVSLSWDDSRGDISKDGTSQNIISFDYRTEI